MHSTKKCKRLLIISFYKSLITVDNIYSNKAQVKLLKNTVPNLTFIRAISELYKHNYNLNDTNCIENIFSQINEIPTEVLEIYINIIIGYYILNYEDNNESANRMLDVIISHAKHSLKFSHKCFWNLLSCKYTYKKLTDLPCIVHLMGVLMNEWMYKASDCDVKLYNSIFYNAKNYNEFCKVSLALFNDEEEVVKTGAVDYKLLFNKNKENHSSDFIEKWKIYCSGINFINDLISVSNLLIKVNRTNRNETLTKILTYLNNNLLPFELDDYIQKDDCTYLKKIETNFSFCLSTKDHVPYHLMLIYSKDNLTESESLIEEDNNNNLENFYNNNIKSEINSNFDSQDTNDIKENISTENENTNQSVFRFINPMFYINKITQTFKCGLENQSHNIKESNNENIIKHKEETSFLSPDSIGLFGDTKFSDIKNKIHKSFPNDKVVPLIIKSGEDLRQDLLVSQIIEIMLEIFHAENINIFLQPLNIIATGKGGIMETLTETTNLTKINQIDFNMIDGYSSSVLYIDKEINTEIYSSPLYNYYLVKYRQGTEAYTTAINNFISSLAGYSLLCYIFEIKDRNNGNILINDEGYIIHIDFGFLLDKSPGNIRFEQAPFKLTYDFVELMRGTNSVLYKKYIDLMIQGFRALQKHSKDIINFIQIFIATNWDLPCFENTYKIIDNLCNKFNVKEKDIPDYIKSLATDSYNSWTTQVYDGYQKCCVGIK